MALFTTTRRRALRALRALPALAAALAFGAAGSAAATVFEVAKDSEVSFLAKITASSFVAKSTALSGAVDYDEATSTIRAAQIKLKADSFATGMGMRDGHMRDKYLEAKKFPEIVFEVAKTPAPSAAGKSATLEGTFIIKGVKKPVKIEIKVAESAAGTLKIESRFKLDITDFGIAQPKYTVVSMDPVIDVTLALVLAAKR